MQAPQGATKTPIRYVVPLAKDQAIRGGKRLAAKRFELAHKSFAITHRCLSV